ncbi:MAG: hypothetical protein ACFB5Z_17420 [Elainellaceae cyanobacterium]
MRVPNLPRQVHMRTLKRLIPQAHFIIIIDPPHTGTARCAPTTPPSTSNSLQGQQGNPSAKAGSHGPPDDGASLMLHFNSKNRPRNKLTTVHN